MQVTASVVSTQRVAHHRRKPAPLNTTRIRHPTFISTKGSTRLIHSSLSTRKDRRGGPRLCRRKIWGSARCRHSISRLQQRHWRKRQRAFRETRDVLEKLEELS